MKIENWKLKIKRVHIIGIGGVAMAGIAYWYLKKGWAVSGSDVVKSEITEAMKKSGVMVRVGQKASNVGQSTDKIIYSEAVPPDNIELERAKTLGIKCQTGAQALAEITRNYFLIAVSGMHGKTTTALMLAFVLEKAGFDPTYIIGAKNGWRVGKSKYLIIEADDYKAKFLHYQPDILVLTNIDKEHLDYFKGLNHIMRVFRQYIKQVKSSIVANKDDKNILKLKTETSKQKLKTQNWIFYSLKGDRELAEKLKTILQVPGKHNISNGLAVVKTCRLFGIKDAVIFKSLSQFKGVWRRLEFKELKIGNPSALLRMVSPSNHCKLKIIHDYAHHPTEIKASLQALKEKYPEEKIVLFFQPHQYQRTYYLWEEFIKVFQKASKQLHKIFITDIYDVQGRENKAIKAKISSQKLVKAIAKPNVFYISKANIISEVAPHELNVLMGAGDIYNILKS